MLWQNHFHCFIYKNWFDKHYLRTVILLFLAIFLLKLKCLYRIYIKMAGWKADKQADKYPDRHSDMIAFALLLRSAIGWYRRVSMPVDSSSFRDVHLLFTYAAYLGRDEQFCQRNVLSAVRLKSAIRCNRRDIIFFHFFLYCLRCHNGNENEIADVITPSSMTARLDLNTRMGWTHNCGHRMT